MPTFARCLMIGAVLLCFGAARLPAAEPTTVLLWPDGAPGAHGGENDDKPTLTIWPAPPEKATGTAIIICPGGGYNHLALDKEGEVFAKWLNPLGITACVLKYRQASTGYHYPAPIQDGTRAVRYLRANAEKWKIDPSKIGIMGFSAGGHLASTVATHFDKGNSNVDDPVERASSRPDFLILCYAVISMTSEYTHKGSKKYLLGDNPDPDLAKSLSGELQVTPETPPTFLFHTDADTSVPAENAVQFYLALRKAKVPAELHIYQNGKHGVGMASGDPVLATWKDRLVDWLKVRGLLERSSGADADAR